jgi:hypothetical protein
LEAERNSVLKASYQRVLVDEYQDCTVEQHALIVALSRHLPACILGDHLQAIFGFRDDVLADWEAVTTDFPLIGKLSEPWRWKRVKNCELGTWLITIRDQLEASSRVSLAGAPTCVFRIPPQSSSQQDVLKANIAAGRRPRIKSSETLIVIGDKASEVMRAALANKMKCSAIEPVACKTLGDFLQKLGNSSAKSRLALVLDFAKGTMSGIKRAPLERRIIRRSEGWSPRKAPTYIEQTALDILASNDLSHVHRLLEGLRRQAGVVAFRRELLFALQNTLKLVINGEYAPAPPCPEPPAPCRRRVACVRAASA